MAHSLLPPPAGTSAISARTPRSNRQWNCHQGNAAPLGDKPIARFHHRRYAAMFCLAECISLAVINLNWFSKLCFFCGCRVLICGLIASGIGSLSPDGANAAQRRPPPPPLEEKNDPSVSGLQAKVLASKKRKEAMKEEMAKLREKGKPVGSWYAHKVALKISLFLRICIEDSWTSPFLV